MEIVDYLLARKKAGGGSDVTIKQLTATENGTYSEEGIAYSPVVVNVPAPENSYQLTDIPTGTVSTIDDGTDLPMSSLKVGIEPVQDLHGYDHPWAGGAGKNLFDKSTMINGLYSDENFTVIQDTSTIYRSCKYYLKAGTYTFSTSREVRILRSVLNGVYSSSQTNLPYTFTITNDGYVGFSFRNEDDTDWNINTNCQIELGNQATSYEPYSNICPISGWIAANVNVSGRNLFYMTNDNEINAYLDETNKIITNPGHTCYYFPCKANATYTVSKTATVRNGRLGIAYSYEVPSNNLPIYGTQILNSFVVGQRHSLTTTTDASAKYIIVWAFWGVDEDSKDSIQLEFGSEPTTFTPYNTNSHTYTIQFKDGDNPLTVYGGTLDVTTGELVVDRAILTIDENSNVTVGGYGMNFKINTPTDAKAFPLSSLWQSKCNMMTEVVQASSWGIPATYSFAGNSSQIYFKLKDDLIDVDELKAFLTENPIKICYILNEPITYHLTPTQIRTLVGNNNIWADTGNIIEGSYFKSLS